MVAFGRHCDRERHSRTREALSLEGDDVKDCGWKAILD